MEVMGISGLPGSGKSLVSEIAAKKGAAVVSMGDIIREEAKKRGESSKETATNLRKEHGKYIVAKLTIEKIKKMIEDKLATTIIVEGIRSPFEVNMFKENFDDFIILSIFANPAIRFKRLQQRNREDDSENYEDFLKRDQMELDFGIGTVISLSDKIIINEKDLESYEKEKASLEKEEDECHKQLEQAESQSQNTEHFIKLAHKYTDFSELTPSMINEFISKIVVHRPIELSGTRTVEVEVYLNYIGKFSVPEEPVILSEEELAEKKIADEKREKSRAASRKYMTEYRKRIKEMKEAGLLEPKNISAEMKGEWL